VVLASYLAGVAAFFLTQAIIDMRKEKKRVFRLMVSPSETKVSEKPLRQAGFILDYSKSTPALAGLHLIGLGVSLMCGLEQIIAVIVSFLAPSAIVCYSILYERKQRAVLENQVESLLNSIVNSLYGSPAITNALREAEEVAEQPMKKELTRALKEIDHGCDIASALKRFSYRVDNEIVDLAVDGILICRETGGSLSRLLEGLSSVARTRSNLKGRIKALTAQQKTTATFVAIIPIGFVLFTQSFSQTYQESFKTSTGIGVIAYASISVVVGFLWLNKMTDILRLRAKR
jgi:tight adherence protein B